MRVQLTNPVSRFKHIQSLQHMCRYVITSPFVPFVPLAPRCIGVVPRIPMVNDVINQIYH